MSTLRLPNRGDLGVALAMALLLAAAPASAQPPVPGDRMAAHHLTMVAVNETRPNAGLLTYVVDRFTQVEAYGLARVSVHAELDGRRLGPADATAIRVEDLPGGVRAAYRLGAVRVFTEVVPLLRGRGPGLWEGSAVFAVRTEPPVPIEVRVGGSRTVGFQSPRAAWLQAEDPTSPDDRATRAGDAVALRAGARPVVVAVRAAAADNATLATTADGRMASARFGGGHGRLVLAYAREEARALELATEDPVAARCEVAKHFAHLLRARIQTSEPMLDAAFRSAITTLEYNWIEPIGWNECIHHWYSLWHMQHSPAAEWLGQADRSRTCIFTHAANLLPNGAAPQLSVDGRARRDFGGSNQFYAWQIRHYLRHTGDRDAARRLAPAMDRIIEQTWAEYDLDGNGLLAWGQQIGNQEDYISTPNDGTTPTIEGIQMLLARAEMADLLGDRATASSHRRRADRLRQKLLAALWMPELGRFAFFRDALDVLRLDGQYHTFAYPAIYGIVDMLDAWTGVRHMRETLTGKEGEVYCSNNFPWHAVGTWGMQAGAAQQPWAAWALAGTGHRNETYRPLLAAARWAMDANHRGAWPEISVEATPAYFSPPAGLYIQSVIEALFGLTLDAPAQAVRIRPSFPDVWPRADLSTPEVTAAYRRTGNVLTYDVRTVKPMSGILEWALPVCRVQSVTVNGKNVPFRTRAAVDGIILTATSPRSYRSVFVVAMEPRKPDIRYRRLAVEGEPWSAEVRGCRIESVEDRSGVLASVRLVPTSHGSTLYGRLRMGLLTPYDGYGKLGRIAFSRRTLFLRCETPDGVRYAAPVTVTVLPPTEAAASITPSDAGAVLNLRIRNNRTTSLAGRVEVWPGMLDGATTRITPRSEGTIRVAVPRNMLALLTAGENALPVLLPDGSTHRVPVDARPVHDASPELRAWLASRAEPIPLPVADLRPDTEWRGWREWYAYGHWPWANSRPPLESLAGKTEVHAPGLPEAPFRLADRSLVPISRRVRRPSYALDLAGKAYRKLYLLIVPFLDNHDTFSPVARISVHLANGGVRKRTLHFPGDLDWWCPPEIVGQFATARADRPQRFALLPSPDPDGAWPMGMPPAFPQPELWATCLPIITPSGVMSVVELDLGEALQLAALTIETLGSEAALGLAAVTGERALGYAGLAGTPYAPPPGFGEATPLFGLTRAGDLEGWSIEGDVFAVAPVPGLFDAPTLNSLAARGEQATGRAVSPPFVVTGSRLRFRIHGGLAGRDADGPTLAVRILDAATGEELASLQPPGTHLPTTAILDLREHRGKAVRMEIVDRNAGAAYAWIGISDVVMTSR
ncbi:MAG: hypothetical protein GX446_05065 [Chthonomonadales bacterium]|nr:hypothetical protein [Chthonomonadales bacterium]